MRALLVHNPKATRTSPQRTRRVVNQLRTALKLDVEETQHAGHAITLSTDAVAAGYEVVIAVGGDGTVNEVLQGLATTNVKLAIIPDGSTNVWARTLGLPRDSQQAVRVVLEKLAAGQDRRIGLGQANGRWFGFGLGYGFDAEVVRQIEQRPRLKHALRQGAFLLCGVRAAFGGYDRATAITLAPAMGAPTHGLASVIVANSSPYTFLGPLPACLCPLAKADGALEALGMPSATPRDITRLLWHCLVGRDGQRCPRMAIWSDLDQFVLSADRPVPLQADGEYLGAPRTVVVRGVAHAVTVVA